MYMTTPLEMVYYTWMAASQCEEQLRQQRQSWPDLRNLHMQEQTSHSQEGSGRVLAARRQSTEHTDEEQGQVAGAGRRELSVQFGDSAESDEDPDPPEDPLLNSLPELSVLERLGLHSPQKPCRGHTEVQMSQPALLLPRHSAERPRKDSASALEGDPSRASLAPTGGPGEAFLIGACCVYKCRTSVKPAPDLCILNHAQLPVALTEQDVEAAFAHLALAFRCDMFTLRRRVQVEERARNVAEENIQQELEECRAALQRLGLSCVDPKRKELVRQLQQSLTVLVGSVERAMSAAEKLGAVHQEARMSRAAEVMVQHVENLKRHHLREHTELEEMKRLIQQNSRNWQLAENRDDSEQRLKLPLMRTFQQASARRRVSIAVIPKQLTLFPSPESGRAPEGEAAKAAWESSPSTERETCCLQEDSTNGYFILRSDSSNYLHRSQPQADRIKCEGDRGRYAEGSEPELWRRGSTSKPMKEEPDGASDSGGLTEELEQLSLTSPASGKEIPRPWVFLPQHYWLFLGLLFLGLTCLVLMRILELQKQQPAPPPHS